MCRWVPMLWSTTTRRRAGLDMDGSQCNRSTDRPVEPNRRSNPPIRIKDLREGSDWLISFHLSRRVGQTDSRSNKKSYGRWVSQGKLVELKAMWRDMDRLTSSKLPNIKCVHEIKFYTCLFECMCPNLLHSVIKSGANNGKMKWLWWIINMIKVAYLLLWEEGLNKTLSDKVPPEFAVSLMQASLWP